MTKIGTTLTLMILTGNTAQSSTHRIDVNDNTFSPNSITIEAGDTIIWENYGVMNHNVASTHLDYIFRCAQGCDDTNGNGDPAGQGWLTAITFHEANLNINYVCEPHAFNMFGSIQVNTPSQFETVTVDVANGFTPNDITIPVGGRVRFINGGGEHNIKADGDEFQCAQGCRDDGIEGDESPTGFPWEVFKVFNQAGTFHYHCENPDHNETGVIHVVDLPIFANGFESP